MTDRAELEACPFCGGEAKSGEYWPTWDTREANVWCYMECGASVVRKTEAEAIAAWNTRAQSDALAVLREAEGALAELAAEKTGARPRALRTLAAIRACLAGQGGG
jgi:hypothetical protein